MRHRFVPLVMTLPAVALLCTAAVHGQGAPGAEQSIFAQGDRPGTPGRRRTCQTAGSISPIPGETGCGCRLMPGLRARTAGRDGGRGERRAALREEHKIQRGAVSALGARPVHGAAGSQMEPHSRCKPSGGPRQLMTPSASNSSISGSQADPHHGCRRPAHVAGDLWMGGRIRKTGAQLLRAQRRSLGRRRAGRRLGRLQRVVLIDREGNPTTEQLH